MKMFKTSDLYLATVISLSHSLRDITTDGKRATFHFDDSTELKTLVDMFWDGNLKVEPLALFTAMKTLKSRIYALERGKNDFSNN